jgi:hypothetical protein
VLRQATPSEFLVDLEGIMGWKKAGWSMAKKMI